MKQWIHYLLMVAMVSAMPVLATAQPWPSRPVRLIVPFAPGGTTDLVARVVGGKLAEVIGQSVVVDNRAGGGTIIGTEALARSPADGYTVMLATPDFTVNPSLRPRLPYDALKDFTPIGLIGTYPMVMVVNADQKFRSVADLIVRARAEPRQINFASAGNGSMPHLCGALFNSLAGIELTHIPYKGNGPALVDLLAGRVSVLFTGGPTVAPHVKSGKLTMLGVSTAQRHPSLPDIPTLSESGVAGYDVTAWFGFIAPAGIPKEIVARLNADIARTLQDPEVREKLSSLGAELGVGSPEAFSALIRDEIGKWARVVRDADIKGE